MARNSYKKKQPVSRKLWFFTGFILGCILTVTLTHIDILTNFFNAPKPVTPSLQKKPKAAKKLPQFDFYNILKADNPSNKAETSVKPSTTQKFGQIEEDPISAPVVSKSLPEVTSSQYFLQAAALRKSKDADRLKAKLILAGYNVHVKKVSKNKMIWYRVLIGPYQSKASAEVVQIQLNKQRINSHMVRQEKNS